MLELIKKTNKEKRLNEVLPVSNIHYPSSVREWNNSIYVYSKPNLNLIPFASKMAKKLIKNILSVYNQKMERELRTKRLLLRFRRLSSNRIYVSDGEFKHTNSNVTIDIYIYNRQINNYIYVLKNRYLKSFFAERRVSKRVMHKLNLINYKGMRVMKNLNAGKFDLLNKWGVKQKSEDYKINVIEGLSHKTKYFYRDLLNLTMKKLCLFFFFKQLIYMNRSKLNYNYIYFLKRRLENLYNKNVNLNLINLNRFYLNSDILFDSVKLKLTRDRKILGNVINKVRDKVKIHSKKYSLNYTPEQENLKRIGNKISLKPIIFDKLKYKHITGFRLEAKGRLNKRYTAARSLSKLRQNGNLLNLDSSVIGLSSVVLRGNLRSNIQYTKLNSTTRIGSFGLKGWVSGY